MYSFPAKKPDAVVNSTIRRHCLGLDFPTANPIKHFKIVSYKGKKPCYGLIDAKESPSIADTPKTTDQTEMLPEERIQAAYKAHIAIIEGELNRQIMNNHPSFFEKLIVDLLIKMGYGYDQSSGMVVGGSHDGGIDGIINEDKLGLDLIYLQAKRYKQGITVGRKELQAFVGAMQNVQKGVFITTSSFTKRSISLTAFFNILVLLIMNWDGQFDSDYICIDDSNERFWVIEQLLIQSAIYKSKAIEDDEVLRFSTNVKIRFKKSNGNDLETAEIDMDYALFEMISAMREG